MIQVSVHCASYTLVEVIELRVFFWMGSQLKRYGV